MTTSNDTSDAKALLCSGPPLTAAHERFVLDRIYQLERDIATIQHEACIAARDRDALLALITNDGHAMTFQTLGQYRSSLVASHAARKKSEG